MNNPEIEKYVDTSMRNGMEAASVKRILMAAGWDGDQVDKAIATWTETNNSSGGSAASKSGLKTNSAIAAAAGLQAKPKRSVFKTILAVFGVIILLVLIAGGVVFFLYGGRAIEVL
jgi:hypothetical protein